MQVFQNGGGGGGGGALSTTGSMGAPENVLDTGVSFTSDSSKPRQLKFIQGYQDYWADMTHIVGPAVITITAGVGVAVGSVVGEELWLCGTSDDYTVKFAEDTAYTMLKLNGAWTAYQNSILKLMWNGLQWIETGRNGL